jgi:catechol 2,3-dioxygenase-like lactoylglutathione lyase family enzyme
MTLELTTTHLLVDDPERALPFYRDALGLQVLGEVAKGPYKWITLASADHPANKIVLSQPHAGRTQEDGDALARLLAKGSLNGVIFSSKNLDETFGKLRAAGVEIVQEPTDQPWGVRDCAVRDPAGNMIRISQA